MAGERSRLAPSIIGSVGPILAAAYSHSQLNALFMAAGFPGDPPDGNKVDKCIAWLRRANQECDDPLARFGRLIAEFMDKINARQVWDTGQSDDWFTKPREAIRASLAAEGLTYSRGGAILGAALSGPSRSLGELLVAGGVDSMEREFKRAYENIENDPAAAVTAACAILEAVCKAYLEAVREPLPSKQTVIPLWAATARHLGLNPAALADDDLKKILTGLYSIVDGTGSLRTHEGSAHGRAPSAVYKLEPRHARLAVHAAHTLAMFAMETWKARAD